MNLKNYIVLEETINDATYRFEIPAGVTAADAYAAAIEMVKGVEFLAKQAADQEAAKAVPGEAITPELVLPEGA